MNDPQHLSQETLDAVRAGLASTDETRAAYAHIAACSRCAGNARVADEIKNALAIPPEASLQRQLRLRRRGALAQASHGAQHPLRWVASAAALLLGVALYLGFQHWDTGSAPLAQVDAPADVYADVEFYLWLEREQQAQHADNPS